MNMLPKKNVRSTDFTLLSKVEGYPRKCDLLKFVIVSGAAIVILNPDAESVATPPVRSTLWYIEPLVEFLCSRYFTLLFERICLKYTVKCVVLQIGRSLDRSQLVSLHFSLT